MTIFCFVARDLITFVGEEETFFYCVDGIPKNSVVAVGMVAAGFVTRKTENFLKTAS